jgi:hypothetical protein
MKTDEGWASFRDAVVANPVVDAHLEAVRQRALATLTGRRVRAPAAAAMLLQDPEAEAFLARTYPVIWRQGRRRKRRAQVRATALIAAAAALAWMAVVLLPPAVTTMAPVARHYESVPAPARTTPADPTASPLRQARTPPAPQPPDGPALLVRTGEVATRIEFIARDQISASLDQFSVALVGAAHGNPRLYLQSPGSENFVPVN